jgi:transglutaminase-like putative cysteine protease/tetratricopeptide (TPR) repeat protein
MDNRIMTMGKTIQAANNTVCLLPALFFRSAALFVILFQIRLIAGELSDTSVFVAAVLSGFAVAAFLSLINPGKQPINFAASLIIIALVPWVSRAFVAMPRLFIPDSTDSLAINLDSLLLNLDRNNFVSLFPYYWSALSTRFAMQNDFAVRAFSGRKFLRAAIVIDAALLVFLYSAAKTSNIEFYRWPIVIIILFAAVVFLQALALLFSMPPQAKLRIKEICFSIAALLIIVVSGGFLFYKPLQERAIEMGGGLLEPRLFSFDFSRFLKLDSEISMKNDLILIVKKENDGKILLRRMTLSGYNRRHGFYTIEELDGRTHPQRLPSHKVSFEPPAIEAGRYTFQEYFLVNIDASAFIGMKTPVTISPYENWDAVSFNSSYGVQSLISDASIWELYYSTEGYYFPNHEQLGLSESEYRIYTEYGNDERLRYLALEITAGHERYSNKIYAIYNYLKHGDFRYSLKPGIAPDGDQLGRFLFQTKRGYCSYFAFAFTLLLRSIDIPARVAAGFFIDPRTNTFDYYPVRSNMAHAWVEVAFPRYGWIEFDPTTERLAEGEEFQHAADTDPALFERLMREILENRSKIQVREGTEVQAPVSNLNFLTGNTIRFIKNYWLQLFFAVIIIFVVLMRWGFYFSVFLTGNPRKKSIRLMKHVWRRLYLKGHRRKNDLAEAEWAIQLERQYRGVYSMYLSAAAARFAQEYKKPDFDLQRENYKTLCTSLRTKRISLHKQKSILLIFLLVFLADPQGSSDETELQSINLLLAANRLYREAYEADYNENWDKAIELYKEGKVRFPDDSRFPWALGNLFFSQALYGLAWDEYRKAEMLAPDNTSILMRLARTAGFLNRSFTSINYYERVLEIEPDNREAIGSLAWMYFKVHRLADGESLLLSALERFGDDADFSMTLGSIYADMYRYDDGKYWYKKAIDMGNELGDRLFTAVAWYNLSLLESRFYRYDLGLDATNTSLGIMNRASGYLARGEIHQRRLELEKAQKDYEAAYGIDTFPLAKLNLAQIYMVSGRLNEARLYAEACLRDNNNSWMINFGIDPSRYKRYIYFILTNTYSGLAEIERLTPWVTPREKIRSLFRVTSYKLRHAVYIRLYRKYCLAVADGYFIENNHHLSSLVQYYNAFSDYPRRALAYLNKAREFETALIPASIPSYDFSQGKLLNNYSLIEKALYEFDPVWERELISQCYRYFAVKKRQLHEPEAAEEKLFALNRGALRQAGIRLPVFINFTANEGSAMSRNHLIKALLSAGFSNSVKGTGARYTLNIKLEGNRADGFTVFCELIDNKGEINSLQHRFQLQTTTRAGYYEAARTLSNMIFTVE